MGTSTIKSSGGDYTTLTAWEAGECGGTLTEPVIAECYYFSGGLDDNFDINGSATSATNYIKITVHEDARHEGKWDETKFYMAPASNGHTINDDYVIIEYVQFKAPTGGSNTDTTVFGYANYGTLDSCIFNGQNDSGVRGPRTYPDTLGCVIRNCVVFGCDRNFYSGIIVYGSTVQNCTVYDCAYAGIEGEDDADNTITNCCCMNNGTDFIQMTGVTADYNVSSDTSAPGTNAATEKTSYADYFNDRANGDFSLKDTSENLWGLAGDDLSTDFTVDIAGTTRSAWDIGAFEYVAAGGTTTIPIFLHHYNQMMGA